MLYDDNDQYQPIIKHSNGASRSIDGGNSDCRVLISCGRRALVAMVQMWHSAVDDSVKENSWGWNVIVPLASDER